jgi:uncharacterized protein
MDEITTQSLTYPSTGAPLRPTGRIDGWPRSVGLSRNWSNFSDWYNRPGIIDGLMSRNAEHDSPSTGLGSVDVLNLEGIPHSFGIRHVVMQPTTRCNLNCEYCYLPDRRLPLKMSPTVAAAVARSLERSAHPISIVWHGGEPLALGLRDFGELLDTFSSLQETGLAGHNIQTNGSLITQKWCELFAHYEFDVGVSLDGDFDHNGGRLTWDGNSTHKMTMRGLGLLQENGICFSVIAVVSERNVHAAAELYRFLCSTGCQSIGFNVIEREGASRSGKALGDSDVRQFWSDLLGVWLKDPKIPTREFEQCRSWLESPVDAGESGDDYVYRELWPTVNYKGDVVVLSPELAAATDSECARFVVGNVLEEDLYDIAARSGAMPYVMEFMEGVSACKASCLHFGFCGGGQASNKFFELGDFRGTETTACRQTKKFLLDAVRLGPGLGESTRVPLDARAQ